MSALVEVIDFLAAAMREDPLYCLANAVAWLDPLWRFSECDGMNEEGDSVGMALGVTRSAFPDLYVGAVERIRRGAAYSDLEAFICGGITERGVPLDNLEFIGFGIPLTACGVDLTDPELYTARPDLAPFFELFGLHPQPERYGVEVPDRVYTAGRALADSLVRQKDEAWRQVGWALAWLFSCSGNTLIDVTDEALAELEPLDWQSDLEFAIELIEEANGVMLDATAGLKYLETRPDMLQRISGNFKRVNQAMEKGKQDEPRIRLEWPPVVAGGDGSAGADSQFL